MKITLTVNLPEKSPASYTPARSARLFEAENADQFTLCQAKSDLLRAKMVLISEKVNQTSFFPIDVLPVYIADIEQSRLDFLFTLHDIEVLVSHLTEDIVEELEIMREFYDTDDGSKRFLEDLQSLYDDIYEEDSDNRHTVYPAEIYCPTIKRKSFELKTSISEENSDDVVCTLSGDYTSDVLIDTLTDSKEFAEANDKLLDIIHREFAKLNQNS